MTESKAQTWPCRAQQDQSHREKGEVIDEASRQYLFMAVVIDRASSREHTAVF